MKIDLSAIEEKCDFAIKKCNITTARYVESA